MSEILRFTIPVPPVPKGRPIFTTGGDRDDGKNHGRLRAITPERTRKYEADVAAFCRQAVAKVGWRTLDVPVAVTLDIYRRTNAGDLDNYVKAICDAMNRIAYPDDRFIVEKHARMGVDRVHPRAVVKVRQIPEPSFIDGRSV
jgi:Holliday junction resolvase RusA-like endonuclease